MMNYSLRGDLSFALVKGRAVFLDVAVDRYFCLPLAMNAAFRRVVESADLELDQARALEPLVRLGLLVADSNAARPAPVGAPVATRSALVDRPPRAQRLATLAVLLAQANAALTLRTNRLSAIVRNMRRRKLGVSSTVSAESEERIVQLAAAFMRSNIVFSSNDRCLLGSLAMADCLLTRGLPADLCFGVKLPFDAHCWIQSNGLVVNDTYENVSQYTPILVV